MTNHTDFLQLPTLKILQLPTFKILQKKTLSVVAGRYLWECESVVQPFVKGLVFFTLFAVPDWDVEVAEEAGDSEPSDQGD